MDEDDEIIGEFLVECQEGLDRLDQNLVTLEERPDDREVLTEAFRILHTIKGSCGFLGFSQLEIVAHRGENLLSLLRDAVLEMDDEIADALLGTVDAIRSILDTIDETGAEGEHDHTALIAELERLASNEAAPAADAEQVSAEEATSVDESPSVDTVDDAEAAAEPEASEPETVQPETAVPETVQPEATSPEAPPREAGAPSEEAVPAAPAASSDPDRIGDILVDDGSAERTDVEIAAVEQGMGDSRKIGEILVEDGRAASADVEKAATKQRASSSDSTIRVDVGLLDRLMNLVGELVLARNQLLQLTEGTDEKAMLTTAQRLNHITSELQEGVMKTRMQPIGNVWSKLPRVVRDLARQFDKQIRLEMEGKDTELDKGIIEAIKDPLTHIVRNTVDHGIETPEIREGIGKDAEGVLLLRAHHEGGQVNIEITDDGAGIDADKIREKAVEKGVVSHEVAEAMGDKEVVQLIFQPGFSTAQQVSNVSGRGVGMDVVKTNVERIGGSVDIRTEPGAGTTFKIKIPLTLAIIPALIINIEDERYAIPQVSLQELVRLEAGDLANRIETVHGAPVYRLRGRLLPIVDLRDQLGLEPFEGEDDAVNIVVLQADDRQFGLIVDRIDATEEIVVKPLGRQVKDIELFSGATIMGDGRVSLILDVLGLASVSGITSVGGHAEFASHGEDTTLIDDDQALLIVELANGTSVGLPLNQVVRLEDFTPDIIEESDMRPVVQYRGGIMALVDVGPSIGLSHGVLDGETRTSVIVCNHGADVAGLAVAKISDIVLDPEIHGESDATRAVVGGRVIDVVDPDRIFMSSGLRAAEPIGVG